MDDEEPDSLGAAPTEGVDRSVNRTRSTRRDGWAAWRAVRSRRSLPVRAILIVAAVLAIPFFLVPTLPGPTVTAFRKTPRDRVGISYGGGFFEGSHYQRTVSPGHGLFFNGWLDSLYLYPSDQRNYIISKNKDEGANKRADSVIAPTRDRVQVEYQVAAYYKLNTDLLRPFHEQLGLKYAAYTNTGWAKLIQDTFRQQIESALQEQTRRYDVADIFGNADRLITIQNSVQTSLSERLRAALGHDFFCAPTYLPGGTCTEPTFVVKKIDIPTSVVQAFEDNRTSQVKILTNQNIIQQRAAEAEAIQQLNSALSGPAGSNYVLLRAIESGKISFWALPNDRLGVDLDPGASGGTVPTPSGASPNP